MEKIRKRILKLGVTYDSIATGDWQSFITAFNYDIVTLDMYGKTNVNCYRSAEDGYGIFQDGFLAGLYTPQL
ncbi:hypothetical protein ACYULU_07355 [Breznakiellaceae bacterium SP9]